MHYPFIITILALLPLAVQGIVTKPSSSLIQTVRTGFLLHDPFSHAFGERRGVSESGFSYNAELILKAPQGRFFDFIFHPAPHFGFNVHTQNITHSAYAGLTWRLLNSENRVFLNVTFGGLLHTGETTHNKPSSIPFGTKLLFRESVEIGAQITSRHALSFIIAHASNAGIGKYNPGLNTLGFRFGYTF